MLTELGAVDEVERRIAELTAARPRRRRAQHRHGGGEAAPARDGARRHPQDGLIGVGRAHGPGRTDHVRGRRRRVVRAGGRAVPARRRARGHRRSNGPTIPGGRVGVYRGPGLRDRQRRDRSDHARTDHRGARRRRRRPRPPDPSRCASSGSSRAITRGSPTAASIDVYSDPDAMAAEVERRSAVPARRAATGGCAAGSARIFDAEYDRFMDANFDSPLDLVDSRAARADLADAGRGSAASAGSARGSDDSSTTRGWPGSSPSRRSTPASRPPRRSRVYGAIPHMDTSLGRVLPRRRDAGDRRGRWPTPFTAAGGKLELRHRGGADRLRGPSARAASRTDRRAPGSTATRVIAHRRPRRAARPRRPRGRRRPAGLTVRGGRARAPSRSTVSARAGRRRRTTPSISARPGTRRSPRSPPAAGRGRLMSDPSLLITRPARHRSGSVHRRRTATGGTRHEPLSVLAPCPNLDSAPLDWTALGPAYVREVLGVLEARGYIGIADAFHGRPPRHPADLAGAGHDRRHARSPRHICSGRPGRSGPATLSRTADNVVLAGCGTTPGVGVPTALLSGKLARRADRRTACPVLAAPWHRG